MSFRAGWEAEGATKKAIKATKQATKSRTAKDFTKAGHRSLDALAKMGDRRVDTKSGELGMRSRRYAPKAAVAGSIGTGGTIGAVKLKKERRKKNG